MSDNIILMSDSYKVSHYLQYPKNVAHVFSYFEARHGSKHDKVMFFGLQALIKKYLLGKVLTQEKIDEAAEVFKAHFGSDKVFFREGWEYILAAHDGYLPLRIKAVPEGTLVPKSNLLMSVENTDPNVPWLTNYVETLLSQVWFPSTVATYSYEAKKIIQKYLEETGDVSGYGFKLHDFGFRGVSSVESAGFAGLAHLVNFLGTDTLEALTFGKKYYGNGVEGYSIPAAEHSTMTAWGKEGEKEAYENMLNVYPTGLVAVVSDSWDIFNAVENIWGDQLKDKVMNRDGTLVIRPDSGDPASTSVKLMNIMGEKFGYTTNEKGFKVLDSHVRMIWGDGINNESMTNVLEALKNTGWSADNIAFGSGGALLQKHDRDECAFAFKCSSVRLNDGTDRDVYKTPATDPLKNSKRGRIDLYKRGFDSPEFITATSVITRDHVSATRTVFENGKLLVDDDFATVKSRALA